MNANAPAVQVLIIDADPGAAERLAESVRNLGYQTATIFTDGEPALVYLDTNPVDVILLDVALIGPDTPSGNFIDRLLGNQRPLLFTASDAGLSANARQLFTRARVFNPYTYLIKPINEQQLYFAIELALQRYRHELRVAKAEDWYPLAGRTNLEGFWNWDIATNQISFTLRSNFLLGPDSNAKADPVTTLDEYIERLHPEDRDNFRGDLQEHISGASPFLDNIHRIATTGGPWRWVHCMGIANRDAAGAARFITGSIGDITGRKETEESLSESRRFIQWIAEAMPAILYTYDVAEQRIIYINRLVEEILGYSPQEIIALEKNFFNRVVAPEDRHRIPANLADYAGTRHGAILESEIRMVQANGERCWLSLREVVYTRDAQGLPLQVIGTAQDITRRKDAELDLIQEKEWQIVTLHSIGDGVITTDRQGRVISMNPAARRLCGFQTLGEAAGRGIDEIYVLIDERTGDRLPCPVRRALHEGATVEYFTGVQMRTEDGRKPNVSLTANLLRNEDQLIIGAVAVLRDETEKVQTEREMRKIQALDSLGILAGGIAHDFNNVMTAIQNHISLARMHVNETDVLEHRLREAENALSRVQGLTRQLLTFARGGDPIKRTTAVGELILESSDFVLRGSNVTAHYDIPEDLWPADLDETQFSTVINNLVINAIHAMQENAGGNLWIRCENVDRAIDPTQVRKSSEKFAAGYSDPFPGDFPHEFLNEPYYLRISVQDEGGGISPENLERIFDPYFTTKVTGTGLGLSSAYSIIKRHAGLLRAHSIPGQGTRFQIFLPARPGASTVMRNVDESEPQTGTGRILIMDDEEDIRETLGLLLERLGYEIAEAATGQAAVDMYTNANADGVPFDLVILDLTVPGGMGGLEAARLMQAGGGGARFIASSGYSNDPVIANPADYGFAGALAKPFRMKELSRLISEILNDAVTTDRDPA